MIYSHEEIRQMFIEAKLQGKLIQVHHRRGYRPDVDGLRDICKKNLNICFIDLARNIHAGYCDEYFYECKDDELAKIGRKCLEDNLLNPKTDRGNNGRI